MREELMEQLRRVTPEEERLLAGGALERELTPLGGNSLWTGRSF